MSLSKAHQGQEKEGTNEMTDSSRSASGSPPSRPRSQDANQDVDLEETGKQLGEKSETAEPGASQQDPKLVQLPRLL